MTKKILAAISIMAGVLLAQTSLTAPQVGFMHDMADSVHPVYGLAGNFLVGEALASGVVSAAFSGSYALLKTGTAIVMTDRAGEIIAASPTVDGPAQFSFACNGEPVLAYLGKTGELLVWKAGTFEAAPFDSATLGAGAVLSVAASDSEHGVVIVQRDGDLWNVRIRLATGEIDSQTAITGVTPPLLMLPTGELVFSGAGGIVIRRADGTERIVPTRLPSSFALEQMGDGWIQLRDLTSVQQFALRITGDTEQIYQLPEASQ